MENFHLQNRVSACEPLLVFGLLLSQKKKRTKTKNHLKKKAKVAQLRYLTWCSRVRFTLKWIITPISGLHARISLVSRTPCPCRLQSSKVNTRTRCPSVPPGSTCRPSTPCSGAACPTLSSRWRQPGSARGTAGSSSVWSPCRCWRCTYQRRTGAAVRGEQTR